jgi:hypothetical protein
MIKSPCKRNRNDPFGRIAAGGEHGREITNGTKGIVEGKTDGTGEAGEDTVENGTGGTIRPFGVFQKTVLSCLF